MTFVQKTFSLMQVEKFTEYMQGIAYLKRLILS